MTKKGASAFPSEDEQQQSKKIKIANASDKDMEKLKTLADESASLKVSEAAGTENGKVWSSILTSFIQVVIGSGELELGDILEFCYISLTRKDVVHAKVQLWTFTLQPLYLLLGCDYHTAGCGLLAEAFSRD